jgi:hypothetical protein
MLFDSDMDTLKVMLKNKGKLYQFYNGGSKVDYN